LEDGVRYLQLGEQKFPLLQILWHLYNKL
jgi:hypothetical protein